MRRLLPTPGQDIDDAGLLEAYAYPGSGSFVRFNFVSSIDGAATLGGLSGALGTAADKRLFMLLRRQADVILVGAGTVRAEGYEGELLDESSRAWRLERGMPERPALAVVSGRLDLRADDELFTQSPARILLLASGSAAPSKITELGTVADVIASPVPGPGIDPRWIIDTLRARGLSMVHSEGGPTLFDDFARAGAVDSLCVTYSPTLVGGDSPRIAHGHHDAGKHAMALRVLFEEDGALLAEYRRP